MFPELWATLYLYPLLAMLALWGALTMGLLWLNQRPVWIRRVVLFLMLGVLVVAHAQLLDVRHDLSIWGCYRAFFGGMLIWTWHELAFYSSVLTGPWQASCPANLTTWGRFRYALRTHWYHEAAVFLEVVLLWILLHDATNNIGLLTFVLMWALQHSAKLNVLLGVPNLNVALLPENLRYLGTFWCRRPSNPFFFPSVLFFTVIAIICWAAATQLPVDEGAIGMTLLASLTTAGVLEHWVLRIPFPPRQQAPITSQPKPDNGL